MITSQQHASREDTNTANALKIAVSSKRVQRALEALNGAKGGQLEETFAVQKVRNKYTRTASCTHSYISIPRLSMRDRCTHTNALSTPAIVDRLRVGARCPLLNQNK